MTPRERTMWEQAVRVLQRNTVTANTITTVEPAEAERVLAKARERAAPQRRKA